MAFAGDDNRVDDRATLPGFGRADEQEVFLAHRRRADGVFDQVVADLAFAVLELHEQCFPLSEKILACFARFGFRAAACSQLIGRLADDSQVGDKAALAQLRASMRTEPSAPLAFPVVKRTDLAEQKVDRLWILIGGFDELAPHMRPAGGAG